MKRRLYYIIMWAVAVLALTACGNVEHDGTQTVAKGTAVYRGGVLNGKYEGYGQLAVGDSMIYEGQWHKGMRSGHGVSRDSLGRRIVGFWRADTLVRGVVADSLGTYNGELNRDGFASGHGTFTGRRHDLYIGEWRDGMRNGLGFALGGRRHAQVGEWKADRYKGERLQYTPSRIYGIDISRFQHDVGRKHYPIHWDRLRISHLGMISKKNVAGRVDYPVSFCYIKATEGTTLRNRYYRSDYAAARRRGIPCGAYHFFSTRTSGTAQAHFFLRNAVFRKGDFPPVLDVEPSAAQIKKMGGPEAMFAAVRAWLRAVESRVGVKPVLYVSQTFVNRYLPLAPDLKRDYNVWIARYGEYKPDVHLVFWQLCPDGRVSGIRPEVDINVFNGYRSEFDDFCKNQCIR